MESFHTSTPLQTQKLAASLAKKFKGQGGIIALIGSLGAGKTTFAQGFAKGLGIEDKIISPTFVLIRQHPIPKTDNQLFHIDLYRLDKALDLKEIGLSEILKPSVNIVLIEWAEKIIDKLPKNTTVITFKKISENERNIQINQI